MNKFLLMGGALLTGAMLGPCGAAMAQTAPAATPPGATSVEEVIVTAQKRNERLQDVPIQVNVLTAKSIDALQIKQTTDIVTTIPNLTVEKTDTYTNSVIVLRGISQASNSDSPVAVIVDGVPQDDPKQFNMHLFDISQIEVLKGPQGSLYGRNAEAGAIIITTAAPSNELHGYGDASYGNGETLDLSGGVSGALVPDKVQFRLAGSFFHTGGLIENSFTEVKDDKVSHDWTLRGNLYFHLSDTANLNLIAQHEDFKAAGVYFVPVFSGNANDFVDPQGNFPNRGSGSSTNLTAKFDDDLGFATFTSISGYAKLKQIQTTDVDFTAAPAVGDNQPFSNRILSQEFRLVGGTGTPLRWLVAADYLNADQFISTNIFLDTGHPDTDPTNPANIILSNPARNKRSNYGASAQVDYDVAGGLTLTAGARYDSDHRTQDNLTAGTQRKATFSDFQPKLTATYKFDPTKLVYVTYGVGFRSGGFNPPSFVIPLYDSEKLTNFEAGFKTQWWDRRLTLNGAVFTGHVNNFQFSYIDFASGSEVTGNIDRVKISGAELEARVNPAEGFDLFANLGLAKPEITDFALFPAYVGNETPRANNASVGMGFDYSHPITDKLSVFVRADGQHYSKKFWFIDNTDIQKPKTYWNASLGVSGEAWTLTVWGKNLSDTKAYETYYPAQSTGLPYDVAFPNRPRTFGVELAVRY